MEIGPRSRKLKVTKPNIPIAVERSLKAYRERFAAVPREKLEEAIKHFVECYDADSWKGGGDPADWPQIEADLEAARVELNALIATLYGAQK